MPRRMIDGGTVRPVVWEDGGSNPASYPILTSKYADHLPLHRLEGIFERHGIDIKRSTMCDWVGGCAELLRPIVSEMKRQVLKSPKIHTDDS